ncbi:hypothetical protein ABH926_008275 [Catenulispora sp. GP43]|uniref:DUF475 domain-containing protein n=1 Tax=Catenulispora sp. GP43 TaxID=3156263 RepID=UPI0035138AC4
MRGRDFGVAYGATLLGLVLALWLGGVESATVVAMLAVLEVALSFDNAVVNATVLRRFDVRWQRIFLTVGVLIAVFGMRLVIPMVVLVAATRQSPVHVLSSSIHDPNGYAHEILGVQPLIAAFGGVFLLMIFMDFFLSGNDQVWLPFFERRLAALGERFKPLALEAFQVVGVVLFLLIAARTFATDHPLGVPVAGIIGLATYFTIKRLSEAAADRSEALAEEADERPPQGRQALMLFIYLEVLDASFSFDSVMGGFSVTVDIALFTIGLGIGAAYVRSLTVFLVRKKTLDRYVYLEHGAYYSIGVLAVLLLVEIGPDVPDWLASLAGTSMIVAAFVHSAVKAKGEDRAGAERRALKS